jgi:hypothetical protein
LAVVQLENSSTASLMSITRSILGNVCGQCNTDLGACTPRIVSMSVHLMACCQAL